jgi:hypothetical protein
VGYDVGGRVLELLAFRDRAARRKPEVLDILRHIHSTAWPYLFGKTADDLQQANAADDEYMISDHDLLIGRFISIPRSYASFVPGSLAAGVVRGMLDAAGFPARCACWRWRVCVWFFWGGGRLYMADAAVRHESTRTIDNTARLSCAPLTRAPRAHTTHRVSAHFVEQPGRERSRPTTTILIKFAPSVMQRQAALDAAKRGG